MSSRVIEDCGRSITCPYREGETAAERHERRLRTALILRPHIETWALNTNTRLVIGDYGRHWEFRRGHQCAEWFPESGRLVINRSYGYAIKCYDIYQVIRTLRQKLGIQ